MEQSPGFVAHGEPGLVRKLRCSIYGQSSPLKLSFASLAPRYISLV